MIPVRQAILLTGIIALVMVTLAAASVLSPAGAAGESEDAIHQIDREAVVAEEVPTPEEVATPDEVAAPEEALTLGETVTRGELAMLLSRALELSTRADDPFVDDDGSIFEADIERLAAAGITGGCNPPQNDRFCADAEVTREQAAALLARAFGLTARADDPFIDDDGSIFEADIERLAAAGITNGCNPPEGTKFCPTRLVTGEEMIAFLARAREASPTASG